MDNNNNIDELQKKIEYLENKIQKLYDFLKNIILINNNNDHTQNLILDQLINN